MNTHQDERPGLMVPVDLSTLPPGTRVEYHERTADASGSGVTTSDGDLAGKISTEAPTVSIEGSAASGGAARFELLATGGDNASAILIVIGALAVIAGGVLGAIGRVKLGAALAVCGGLLIGLAWLYGTAGWVLGLAAVIALGVCGWVVWNEMDKKRKERALASVVRGVQSLPEDKRAEVKNTVAKQPLMGTAERAVIEKLKAQ